MPFIVQNVHSLEVAYVDCVYIVSHVNVEKNNNIHMLGWKLTPQALFTLVRFCFKQIYTGIFTAFQKQYPSTPRIL